MKNFNNHIGNRTRGLPACSAVPEPTAPPRAPFVGAPKYYPALPGQPCTEGCCSASSLLRVVSLRAAPEPHVRSDSSWGRSREVFVSKVAVGGGWGAGFWLDIRLLWPGPRNVRGVLYEKRETFRKVCCPGRTGCLDGRGHWVTVVCRLSELIWTEEIRLIRVFG
jgi:hypothetical protein